MRKAYLPFTVIVASMGTVPHWKNAAAKLRFGGDKSLAPASALNMVQTFRGFPASLVRDVRYARKRMAAQQAEQAAIKAKKEALIAKFHDALVADRKVNKKPPPPSPDAPSKTPPQSAVVTKDVQEHIADAEAAHAAGVPFEPEKKKAPRKPRTKKVVEIVT